MIRVRLRGTGLRPATAPLGTSVGACTTFSTTLVSTTFFSTTTVFSTIFSTGFSTIFSFSTTTVSLTILGAQEARNPNAPAPVSWIMVRREILLDTGFFSFV